MRKWFVIVIFCIEFLIWSSYAFIPCLAEEVSTSLQTLSNDEVCKVWDQAQDRCLECKDGFQDLDENCRRPCRYPSYGKDCQSHCNCAELNCDFKRGCEGMYIDLNVEQCTV
ncbi:uncharacterized protein LOC134265051 [Saccostrea cucullata]|uniref:uncharacterized protein LOC134265051 n=1 Tax=Saccostrea cuccullata TaxID=36930 RepID=UPI002ED2906A